jgi:hypothetical protein
MKHKLAGNLDASDLGKEVSVPLSVGASVTDVLTEVFHGSRHGDYPEEHKRVPMTLLRFKNTRPAPDWRLDDLSKPMDWLREFFEVSGDVEVLVAEAVEG